MIYFSVPAHRFLHPSRAAYNVQANLEVQGGVGVVTLNSLRKVNVLNQTVMAEIEKIVGEIEANNDIQAAVLISGLLYFNEFD